MSKLAEAYKLLASGFLSLAEATESLMPSESTTAEALAESIGAPKKAARKPKETVTPPPLPTKTDAAAAPQITTDEVREALSTLAATRGTDKAKAILAQYKAGRVSEIKPEQYEAFLASIKAVSAAAASDDMMS